MNNKKYDLILLGATGYTGQLVARYLSQNYGGQELRWALAGRNQEKLQNVCKRLGDQSIDTIIADSLDVGSLQRLADQTKVICSTVGPYSKFGSSLVETCVTKGVDYCDLTGEVHWIRRMIDLHHMQAADNGVKIVHCCGFDSIPSDMGVYYLQKAAKEKYGTYCKQIKLRVKAAKGGLSGGTYASLSNLLVQAHKDPSIYKLLENPYALNPMDMQRGQDQNEITGAVFDKDFQSWLGPFMMAAINTRVVRRSHALRGFPYGEDFVYDEAMLTGSGIAGKVRARLLSMAVEKITNTKPNSILKKIADGLLPKPGEGPSQAKREKGFFKLVLLGKLDTDQTLQAQVTGDRDPGYGSTSKMLAESAVCLAKDRSELPSTGGVLTPAVAMGDHLLKRLQRNAGLSFKVIP